MALEKDYRSSSIRFADNISKQPSRGYFEQFLLCCFHILAMDTLFLLISCCKKIKNNSFNKIYFYFKILFTDFSILLEIYKAIHAVEAASVIKINLFKEKLFSAPFVAWTIRFRPKWFLSISKTLKMLFGLLVYFLITELKFWGILVHWLLSMLTIV